MRYLACDLHGHSFIGLGKANIRRSEDRCVEVVRRVASGEGVAEIAGSIGVSRSRVYDLCRAGYRCLVHDDRHKLSARMEMSWEYGGGAVRNTRRNVGLIRKAMK